MKKQQSQVSLTEQLIELISLANNNGLYDAADYLQKITKPQTDKGTNPGRFYTKYPNETILEAIAAHSEGFRSIEEAQEEANLSSSTSDCYSILNDQLVVVWTGISNPLDKESK